MQAHSTIAAAAALMASAGLARAQLNESFDNYAGLAGAGWFEQNNSSPVGTIGYFQGNTGTFGPFQTSGYLGVNYQCGSGLSTLSNWMETPLLTLLNGRQFTFWTRSVSTDFPDRLQVRMSTNGTSTNVGTAATDVGDFTTLLLDINPTYSPTGYPILWTQYVVTITGAPAPLPGRLAFRYFVENGGPSGANSNYIGIDEATYNVPFGACCLTDDTCAALTSAQCAGVAGVYHGNGSVCGACPTGACCLSNGSCSAFGPGACTSHNGVYHGDGSACAAVTCTPVSFTPVNLNWNFNGMVHDASEQDIPNRDNPAGYRSVSDRGLLLSGVGNAINAGPIVDPDFMPFALVSQPGQLDIVHLGDRNLVDNGTAAWGSNANTGLQPTWLPNSDQTGPQTTLIPTPLPTFTALASLGVLYQISNGGGSFDVRLGFSDSSSATVTLRGPDWYQDQSPSGPALGVAAQRKLGVYAGTGSIDIAAVDADLNVAEAVINVASLQAAGLGNFAGKQLSSITFQNPVSAGNYPNLATGSGFAIIAATLGGTTNAQACYANCDHSTTVPCLNVLDFGCFLNQFAAGATYANCDNSTTPPVLNVLDFGCFLNKFAAGCSSC